MSKIYKKARYHHSLQSKISPPPLGREKKLWYFSIVDVIAIITDRKSKSKQLLESSEISFKEGRKEVSRLQIVTN